MATDATQIATVQDGKVWLFGVAEHWNAELLGSACRQARDPLRSSSGRRHGGANSSPRRRRRRRGLALRHDHGSNFMSERFQKQIRSWGIAPSSPSSESRKPMASSSALSDLKEQIVYGRIFQTVDEVRDAVRAFAARYNAEWLIEKNGHRSPTTLAPLGMTSLSGAPHKPTACPKNRVRYSWDKV